MVLSSIGLKVKTMAEQKAALMTSVEGCAPGPEEGFAYWAELLVE